jgi:hypothetical protein
VTWTTRHSGGQGYIKWKENVCTLFEVRGKRTELKVKIRSVVNVTNLQDTTLKHCHAGEGRNDYSYQVPWSKACVIPTGILHLQDDTMLCYEHEQIRNDCAVYGSTQCVQLPMVAVMSISVWHVPGLASGLERNGAACLLYLLCCALAHLPCPLSSQP